MRQRARWWGSGAVLLALAAAGPAAAQPAGPLDVDEAVRIALRQNYSFKQAEAAVASASGGRLDALAGLLPGVTGSYSYSHNSSTTTLTDFPVRQQIDDQSGSIVVLDTDNLDLNDVSRNNVFGVSARQDVSLPLWYQYRASNADVKAAEFGREAAAQDLAFNVRQQFYLVLRAQDLLTVQTEDLRLARDEETRINSMFELGSVARVDVLKARVRVAEAEVALIRQQNQVEIENARLATLLGFSPDTRLQLDGVLEGTPARVDSAAAVDEARVRPVVRQSQESLNAARARFKAAALSRLPGVFASFDANGTTGSSESDQIRTATDPGDPSIILLFPTPQENDINRDGWTFRVGASVSLDAFFNMGSHKRARAGEQSARYQLEGLELAVQEELEEAILNYRASVSSIDAAVRGVQAAEEDLRLSQERYRQGLGTVLELLEAQVNLTRARNSLVNAQTGLKISEAAVDKARGAPLPR